MATSFIEFSENGFWENDSITEISLSYLLLVSEQMESTPEWFLEYKEFLRTISLGYFPSYIHFNFEDWLISRDRIDFFINLIDNTLKYLEKKDSEIPQEEINLFVKNSKLQMIWRKDVDKMLFVNFLEKLRELIINKS
ncbi:hypothetical protein [Emticicia sp. 17c]|uniref:hypothetical protein n=1 Tax=Emticicia sp. 17c TaxID=3127704 RepID=UPI00301B8B11